MSLEGPNVIVVSGEDDLPDRFASWTEWRNRETGEVLQRREGGFAKVNVFEDCTGLDPAIDVSTYEKKLICIDHPNAFVSRVEYRRPGEETEIHSSVHVQMKRVPQLLGQQGEF